MATWDGKHRTDQIDVTVVYFVPREGTPLPDWKERVDYFCRRIRQFHDREFQGQSKLRVTPRDKPFQSARTTQQLRSGDGDFIFFQTLREVDADLAFGTGERKGFPILLVLSDINWRPLDDFFRIRPKDTGWEFEGTLDNGRHFPGSALGGARATYLADRGVGWGLVSADGWRVPYCGSDCVVYHEGVGHTVGLPHPEPGNGSVMSLGQYKGWISESWIDDAQKKRLGWKAPEQPVDTSKDLFSKFRAIPAPAVPKPGEAVELKLDWPSGAGVRQCRVRMQTDLWGPWMETPVRPSHEPPATIALGSFDRPTPVSYRIDVSLEDGQSTELWGYFQVRSPGDAVPLPSRPSTLAGAQPAEKDSERDEIDLLPLIDLKKDQISGNWTFQDGRLESPKAYGARVEIPYTPPEEYRLTIIAEPLDEPNGLILGQRSGDRRFLVLLSYATEGGISSALENIDGQNVGNATTLRRRVFEKGRPSQIICTVRKESVKVAVDGRKLIEWPGNRSRLSLSDYWKTPHETLFLGAYDCRYRISRATLQPITGDGTRLRSE